MEIILILLGIFFLIANANAWFAVPVIVIWICFGLAALILIVQLVRARQFKKAFKNHTKNLW